MTSIHTPTLNHDIRSKVSDGLAALEALLKSDLSDAESLSCQEASLTWKAISTRVLALQSAVCVLVDREDALCVSFDAENSDEDWDDIEGEEEEEEISDIEDIPSPCKVLQPSTETELVEIDAISSAESAPPRSAMAPANHSAVNASILCDDASNSDVSSTSTHGRIIPAGISAPSATVPGEAIQGVEFSFRYLSHQLSELSNTLIVECNRTKNDLTAEVARRRDITLERDAAVLEKEELKQRLRDVETQRDTTTGEIDSVKGLLEHASLQRDVIFNEKTQLSSRLREVEFERDELAKEKENILAEKARTLEDLQKSSLEKDSVTTENIELVKQLQQATSQHSFVIKERDDLITRLEHTRSVLNATVKEKDDLSKRLEDVIGQNAADNKVFLERIATAHLQRYAAQKAADDLTIQVQSLRGKKATLIHEKEQAFILLQTASTQLDAQKELTAAAEQAHRSLITSKSTLELELRKLKELNSLLKSEAREAQPLRLQKWDTSLRAIFFNQQSKTFYEDMRLLDKVFHEIESYSHIFPMTYKALKTSGIFQTLRVISIVQPDSIHKEFKLCDRAKALIRRWQASWDEGEKQSKQA
ncbi:hypothetical protein ONZ45_g649 [Pleurotus djamor]|nr:hypothetical protein ONZ45_g649 [Pleurotus djamor]